MKPSTFLLSLLIGCGLDPLGSQLGDDSAPPDEDVAPSALSVSPASVDFGSVAIGDEDSVDLVLHNDSDAGISIEDAALVGDSDVFLVESLFGFPLAIQPGGDALATLSFRPTADQDYAGTLKFAVGNSLVEVPVTGIGGIGGSGDGSDGGDDGDDGGGGDPDGLSVDSSSLSFGSVDTNATGSRSLTLTNNGVGDVLVTGLELSDSRSWAWAPAAGNSFTLAQVISSGSSKTIDLIFSPHEERAYSDSLRVQSDGNPDIVVGLTGTGTEPPCIVCNPTIQVDTGGSDPHIMSFTSVLGFPDARPLIIYNQSDVDLVISNVALTNDTQGGTFTMSGLGATTIGPRGSTSGTVTFTCPTLCFDIENFLTGTNYLTITSNDPSQSTFQVGLRSLPE